jgi:serine/threonine protein kinase
MPEDLQRARELFLHAVGHVPPAQWDAYVAEACGADDELRQQVAHLLQVHGEAGSFLEQPAEALAATSAFGGESAGTVIGPYKLVELIGEGGMGTVWMAQQTEPVKRLVALKLIKAGMDSKQVLARFEAERQALALMDHPNIARVFDAGTTAAGRPYFVMELVKGIPLARYCDEHRLTPQERLELFVPVCQAVQHAHQKGIIHRDLKPSNMLIARYDGRPVPKVIDFGVAKATGQQLTEHTLVTGFGTVVGTLEYMSPEQAELNQLDIDTRSDIYSLGVLLYELLTGTMPLDKKRLKDAAMQEVLRIIREEEPPRPSTRLSTTASQPSIAANRGLEPKRLTGLVRGELDWIVMKALEKDRNRRYETANGFAMDVQRYLAGEPVLAAPASQWYRLRKLVRRHRGPVLAAGLVLLALVGGVAGTTWGLLRAVKERDAKDAALTAEQQAREDETKARQHAFAALRCMTNGTAKRILLPRRSPAYWRMTFNYPPLSAFGPETIPQLNEIITALETDERVKVVVFDSAVDGFFLTHYDFLAMPEDTTRLPPGPTGLQQLPDMLVRLSRAPVVSIASIQGRATGVGSELALASDMRFASREKAILS